MKEFLDSKAGRTLIIALIATGTTIFAVPWDGAETVLRAGGGAFFGALAPLVFYLMKNEGEAQDGPMVGFVVPGDPVIGAAYTTTGSPGNLTISQPPAHPGSVFEVKDFDSDYHFTDDGRHLGKSVDCKLCNP